jgi:enamine deaminase RidA (YjgF/YER057c/UK114 family)
MNRIQPSIPEPHEPVGFSHGYEIKSGRLLFIAGQVAKDADGQVVGRAT